MSKYVVPEKHDKLICPYNKEHVVDAYRFTRHILKCKKFHPEKNFEQCPFNYTHVVPKSEIRHHTANCPDKVRIETDLTNRPVVATADTSLDVPSSEDWESDLCQPAILRKLNADREFKAIIPRSKRKQAGRSNKDIEGWLTGTSQYTGLAPDDEWEPPTDDPQKELRQPRTKPKGLMNPNIASKRNIPKTHHRPLALAGFGRGRAVIPNQAEKTAGLHVPPSSLPSVSPSSSSDSLTSSPARSSESPFSGGSPLGRGRGRGVFRKSESEPLLGGIRPIQQNRAPVPNLSRIAATLGQNREGLQGIKAINSQPHCSQNKEEVLPISSSSSESQFVVPVMTELGTRSMEEEPTAEEKRIKEIRKFKKKLNEIELLRQQLDSGLDLNSDQSRKLQLEDMYKKKLRNLGAE